MSLSACSSGSERVNSLGLALVARPGVPTGLCAALPTRESAGDANQIFIGVVPFSLRFRGHFGAPKFEGARKSGVRILELGVWRRALMAMATATAPDRTVKWETQAELYQESWAVTDMRPHSHAD